VLLRPSCSLCPHSPDEESFKLPYLASGWSRRPRVGGSELPYILSCWFWGFRGERSRCPERLVRKELVALQLVFSVLLEKTSFKVRETVLPAAPAKNQLKTSTLHIALKMH
jgi:hypothetical protein